MNKKPDEVTLNTHKPGYQWLGRSIENYKSMHTKTAEAKGVEKEFKSAKTLTGARKILYGLKRGNTLSKK